jgi:hypothetical protein
VNIVKGKTKGKTQNPVPPAERAAQDFRSGFNKIEL